MPPVPSLCVGVLLRSRTETLGLPLDLLAGADGLLASGGVLVFEHARARAVPVSSGRLVQVRQVRSGDSMATFYELSSYF